MALLLAGCGFQSKNDGKTGNDVPDAAVVDALAIENNCWTIDDTVYRVKWSKCTTSIAAELHITTDQTIDTSDDSKCATLAAGGMGEEVCALVAKKILIDAKATLRATGRRPLALFGNTIEVQGKIDVASYAGRPVFGAGANDAGCNPVLASPAGESGGGAGGSFDGEGLGKDGGDGGNAGDTAGKAGGSISVTSIRGGCFGRRGGRKTGGGGPNAPTDLGGAAGGVVWLAANMGPLTIGPTAIINASGAGGRGGSTVDQGGDGGGSGGLIVLQADTINFDPAATVFANGGDGGSGADGATAGANGLDPGFDGSGAQDPSDSAGAGGRGYPDAHEGQAGVDGHGGGGGGGGGAGAIRFVMPKLQLPTGKIRPTATRWSPRA